MKKKILSIATFLALGGLQDGMAQVESSNSKPMVFREILQKLQTLLL